MILLLYTAPPLDDILYVKYIKILITQDIFQSSLTKQLGEQVSRNHMLHRAPFLWENLSLEYKFKNYLNIFKREIKKWKGENCS